MNKIIKLIKKADQKFFRLIPKLRKTILPIRPVDYFIQKYETYMSAGKSQKGLQVVNNGLKYYSGNLHLNKIKATIETRNGNKQIAKRHWQIIIKKHAQDLMYNDFIKVAENLWYLREDKAAMKVLKKGLYYHPNSIDLLKLISKKHIEKKDWEQVINYMAKLFSYDKYKPEVDDYIELSKAYYKRNKIERAEYILQKGIEENENSRKLLISYVEYAISLYKWELASKLITHLAEIHTLELEVEQKMIYGMTYQLAGKKEKADNIYNDILINPSERIESQFSHQKITIFDNGESRIDFYKCNTKTDKAIITFDSINMTWNNLPFGYKLLSKQNIDIIAVQKRKPKTYQQDLSLEEFLKAVKPLANTYSTLISYGFSLGAYSALYYTGNLDCQILALSPRLSIHPIYGKKSLIGKIPFYDNLRLSRNEDISPIIVYDPKNTMDNAYVNNEVLIAYPDAQLVKIPYTGHRMGPNLLQMGLLKEFILTVIHEDKTPVYNRKAKVHSASYYRHLGIECLKRGKITWATAIINRAYELLPGDINIVKLKVEMLIIEGKYKEAEDTLHRNLESKPNRLSSRIALIDFYIEQKELLKADRILNESRPFFKNSNQYLRKQIEIEESVCNVVNGKLPTRNG